MSWLQMFNCLVICFCVLSVGEGHAKSHLKRKRSNRKWVQKETFGNLLDEKKFLAKLETPPPQWMRDQICEDFQDFIESGISKKQVDETYAKIRKTFPHHLIWRFRVIDNELYRYVHEGETLSEKDNQMEKALKTLLHFARFNDMDFILSFYDGIPLVEMPEGFYIPEKREWQAPVLFSARKMGTPFVVLIPDWRSLSFWWSLNIETVQTVSGMYPWESKKNFAIWRGSLTKGVRRALCHFTITHPEVIDAKLNLRLENLEAQRELERAGIFGSRISWDEFLQNKYLPTADGVCCAAPAVQWRLLSNCVMLKQESDEMQWFYRVLRPFEHYIPVKNDLSNLIEMIEWAKKNDSVARGIAERATQFAKNNLLFEDVYLYFYHVFKKNESLQKMLNIADETRGDPHWINIHDRKAALERNKKRT